MIEEPVDTGDSSVDLAPDPIARARGSDIDAVIDLLNQAEKPDDPAAPETGAPIEPAKPAKLDLKSLAEKLGVEASELYAVKLKTADGEELSIGELKDRVKSQSDAEALRDEARKIRAESEADRIRQERELTALLQSIDPASVKPELRAAYEARQKDYLSREREAMLRTIPEWIDAAVITADRALMVSAIAEYGFNAVDLENVTDHRLLRLVRDFAKANAQAKAAAKAVPPVRVGAAPRRAQSQTPAQQFGRVKAAVSSGRLSPQSAVENLLRGK